MTVKPTDFECVTVPADVADPIDPRYADLYALTEAGSRLSARDLIDTLLAAPEVLQDNGVRRRVEAARKLLDRPSGPRDVLFALFPSCFPADQVVAWQRETGGSL